MGEYGIFTISTRVVGFDQRKDTTVEKTIVLHRKNCTMEDAQRVTNFHSAMLDSTMKGQYVYAFQAHPVFLSANGDWVAEPAVKEPKGISVPVFSRKVRP